CAGRNDGTGSYAGRTTACRPRGGSGGRRTGRRDLRALRRDQRGDVRGGRADRRGLAPAARRAGRAEPALPGGRGRDGRGRGRRGRDGRGQGCRGRGGWGGRGGGGGGGGGGAAGLSAGSPTPARGGPSPPTGIRSRTPSTSPPDAPV